MDHFLKLEVTDFDLEKRTALCELDPQNATIFHPRKLNSGRYKCRLRRYESIDGRVQCIQNGPIVLLLRQTLNYKINRKAWILNLEEGTISKRTIPPRRFGTLTLCGNMILYHTKIDNEKYYYFKFGGIADGFPKLKDLCKMALLSAKTATISEHRIPVAMAVNEYSHVWFKGADITQRSVRCFGTVMISFASTSVPILTDVHSDVEPLQFSIHNGELVKAVLPNKQVVRYEMTEEVGGGEPPLLLTSYWKCEPDHTDIRIDYRLNTDCAITNTALLNLVFTTKVSGNVDSVTSDPTANWNPETATITWTVTELSRHGDCNGSLKARILLKDGVPSEPAQCYAQFQCTDASISGVSLRLNTSDTYHLSMTRRKVLAGKYF